MIADFFNAAVDFGSAGLDMVGVTNPLGQLLIGSTLAFLAVKLPLDYLDQKVPAFKKTVGFLAGAAVLVGLAHIYLGESEEIPAHFNPANQIEIVEHE